MKIITYNPHDAFYHRQGRRCGLYDHCGLSVVLSVFIHYVCVHDYCNSYQPISLELGVTTGTTSRTNWLTFGGDPVRNTDTGSLFYFPHHRGMADLGELVAFLTQSPVNFHDTRRNDWCRQGNEFTTFWERSGRHPDPNTDSSGRTVSNPGSLLVEILALAEVYGLRAQSSYYGNKVLDTSESK